MKLPLRIRYYISLLTNKFKTDSISFDVTSEMDYNDDPDGWEWNHTDIIINNKSLFKRLYEHEYSEAKRTNTNRDLAGKYVGIEPHRMMRTINRGNDNEFSIWQCSVCRSALCSFHLVCRYKVGLLFVKFYDFRQVANPIPLNNTKEPHPETVEKYKWNYETFGPFLFNRFNFFKTANQIAKGF